MINENLSKIGEFGIWLIQWFGDFSKDIKVLQIRTLNSIIRFLVVPLKNQRLAEMQVVFLFQSALTATLRESNGAGFAAHTVHIRKTGAIRRPGCENCDERSPASAFSPLFRLFSLLYTTIFLFLHISKRPKSGLNGFVFVMLPATTRLKVSF